MWVCGLDWAGPGWRQVADACECGNEPSGSVKCGELLDQLQTSQLLKKDSALWSRYVRDINNPPVSQEVPHILQNAINHSRIHNSMPLFRTMSDQSSPRPPNRFLRSILILYSHICLVLPSDLFVRFSHPIVACTSLPLYVPHTLPISLFLI